MDLNTFICFNVKTLQLVWVTYIYILQISLIIVFEFTQQSDQINHMDSTNQSIKLYQTYQYHGFSKLIPWIRQMNPMDSTNESHRFDKWIPWIRQMNTMESTNEYHGFDKWIPWIRQINLGWKEKINGGLDNLSVIGQSILESNW